MEAGAGLKIRDLARTAAVSAWPPRWTIPYLLLLAAPFVRPYGLLGRAEVLLGRIRQPNPEQKRRKQVTHCGLTWAPSHSKLPPSHQ
jgi:hypothetical protein